MFKTISAALVAASLIAGPALAQGNLNAATKAPVAAKVDTRAHVKVVKVKRTKHSVVIVKHRKHAHVRHFRRHNDARLHGKRHVARGNQTIQLRVN